MADSPVPGETCFNLNFSNPGGRGPLQSLLLKPKQTSSGSDYSMDSSNGSAALSPPQQQMPQLHHHAATLPNGKKTKGRVKIKMEYIGNKLRRYTTFSKRKTGIMKKVMLLVASETGHVYTFATSKLKPMINSEAGKALIQNCLNSPSDNPDGQPGDGLDSSAISTEFTFEHHPGSTRKRKCPVDVDPVTLPTMVAMANSNKNNEDDLDSDSDSDDRSPTATASGAANISDAESSDPPEKPPPPPPPTTTNRALQQTLKEALRVAAAQRQLQKRNKGQQQQQRHLNALFASPFLMPGFNPSAVSSTNPGSVMYQMPQGVVYTNGGDATGNGLFMPADPAAAQFITIPLTSLSLQQMMSSAALSAQLADSAKSSAS